MPEIGTGPWKLGHQQMLGIPAYPAKGSMSQEDMRAVIVRGLAKVVDELFQADADLSSIELQLGPKQGMHPLYPDLAIQATALTHNALTHVKLSK